MKLRFFVLLIALCSFANLNAAGLVASFEFVLNPDQLAKPAGMGCIAWIDALEAERNKADCMGKFQAFKAFSREISATIGGKYGISRRAATPEERAALIYSITRTRHKFCGKRNMLSDFYGVGEVHSLESHAKGHLAAILAVDAMATKALDDEDFANQWAVVKPVTPAAACFIASIKEHARSHEKSSVVGALQEPLNTFLTTSHPTISLAYEVFNVFAPKLTLAKISAHRTGAVYRGWNMHGVDVFFNPPSLTAQVNALYPELEDKLRSRQESMVEEDWDVYSSSAVACASADLKTITVEYLLDDCVDEFTESIVPSAPRQLSLSRPFNPLLAGILRRPPYKTPESTISNIYKNEGNWTKTFQTKVGAILHTPTMIQLDGMTNGQGLNIYSRSLNGVPLHAPLVLETNSTESEFLAALRLSGLID